MRKRINLILPAAYIILLLSGCAPALMPSGYRYNIHELPYQISGNWADVKIKSQTILGEMSVSGELIAIQSDTLYLLTRIHLEAICMADVNEVVLYMYLKMPGLYAGITGLLFAPNVIAAIAYGQAGFLAIGIPGLICGTIVTINEGNKSNILKYPQKSNKNDLIKYSRFPQGLPQDIDKSKLHLVSLN